MDFKTFGAEYARLRVLVGRLMVISGVALLMLAAGFAGHSWLTTRNKVRAEATVVENVSAFRPEGGIVYAPRLRFRDETNTIVELVAGPASDDAAFAAGDKVPVAYPAGHAKEAVIATVWRMYFWGILLGIAGTLLFDVGWVFLWAGREDPH